MSLIEELGGYEKAKSIVDNAPKYAQGWLGQYLKQGEYCWHWSEYLKKWLVHEKHIGNNTKFTRSFKLDELRKELLEHRRQHNIFEVGDKVVYQDGAGLDGLFEIEVLTKTGKPKSLKTERFGGFPCGWCLVRHAKDAEIEAGYRL